MSRAVPFFMRWPGILYGVANIQKITTIQIKSPYQVHATEVIAIAKYIVSFKVD